MTWMLLSNGAEQHLQAGAEVPQYTVQTVAHQLAIINRFTGATCRPYSVAEHSLLCADLADAAGCTPVVQLCCLMHDAHEIVTGDASSPVKWELGQAWDRFELRHARALRAHFKLQCAFSAARAAIRHVDLVALATERRDLMPWDPLRHMPWPVLDTPGGEVRPAADVNLRSAAREQMHWTEWRDAFLDRYERLSARVDAQARRWREEPPRHFTTHSNP